MVRDFEWSNQCVPTRKSLHLTNDKMNSRYLTEMPSEHIYTSSVQIKAQSSPYCSSITLKYSTEENIPPSKEN